jgi:hypothetical protein
MGNYLIQCGGELTYIGCPQYMFYSYADTVPEGHVDDCLGIADCDGNCPPGPSCCSNASQSGYIYSEDFPPDLIADGTPSAIIFAGSRIDNNGSVGGVTFPVVTCESSDVATLPADVNVVPEIEGNKLKLPFYAANTAKGGPYGLVAVNVMWYFSCG